MFKCLQIMCAKYYELRCRPIMLFKKLTWLILARLLDKLIASKLVLFSVSGLKDENVDKKANLHEN